jgi:hypothetical protein
MEVDERGHRHKEGVLGPNWGALDCKAGSERLQSVLSVSDKGKKYNRKEERAYLAQRDCSQFSAEPEKKECHDYIQACDRLELTC